MTRPPEFLDQALEEAEDAARWYAERSLTAAALFSEEIDAAVRAIEQAPVAWPGCDHGTRRFLLRRFPYNVVYRVEPGHVVIIAIAHAHRRPGYWTDRLEAPG